jgi:hypothetical protein
VPVTAPAAATRRERSRQHRIFIDNTPADDRLLESRNSILKAALGASPAVAAIARHERKHLAEQVRASPVGHSRGC